MTTRRRFLKLIGAALVAGALAARSHAPLYDPIQWPEPEEDLGISIRWIEKFEIQTDQQISRLNVLYGYGVLSPEFAVRVLPQQSNWDKFAGFFRSFLKAA